MPTAWEWRLVQTSQTTGEEVYVLGKAQETEMWLVLGRNGIGKVRLTDRRVVRSASQGPKVGVAYTPAEVVDQERRDQIIALVEGIIQNREAGVLVLGNDGHGLKNTVRRYMGLLGSAPL